MLNNITNEVCVKVGLSKGLGEKWELYLVLFQTCLDYWNIGKLDQLNLCNQAGSKKLGEFAQNLVI